MKNIIEKCRTTRILAIIGIVGMILGIIMPYIKYNLFGYKYSVSLWHFWEGKIMMILTIANLLFIFKDIIDEYMPILFKSTLGEKIKNCENPKFSLVPTILTAILVIFTTSEISIENFKYYNIGFYAMWLGTISLVAYAFLHKKDSTF